MATVKSSFLNVLITLTIITLAAGLSIGYVHQWTKERIANAQMEKQLRAIESVIENYDNNPIKDRFLVKNPNSTDSLEFFPAKKEGMLIGMVIKTKSSNGYSGDVWLMVSFSRGGEIQRIVVLDHRETPGLGSKMSSSEFLAQFEGKNPAQFKIKVKKDGGDVDAISGATISSRAFSEAVQTAFDAFQKEKIDHEKY